MARNSGITDGLLVVEGARLGLYIDLIVNPGEDPDVVARTEILGGSKATYAGGQWHNGYWEAHFQGTKHQLAALQARSEGHAIGWPKGRPRRATGKTY